MSNAELKKMEIKTIEDAQTLHNFILVAIDYLNGKNCNEDYLFKFVEKPEFEILDLYEYSSILEIAGEDDISLNEFLAYWDWKEIGLEYRDGNEIKETYDIEDYQFVMCMCMSDRDTAKKFISKLEDKVYEAFGELVNFAVVNKVIKVEDDELAYYTSHEWELSSLLNDDYYIKKVSDDLMRRITSGKQMK